MDNGASSYRRFLAGDNEGLAEIVREYSDGLTILKLNPDLNSYNLTNLFDYDDNYIDLVNEVLEAISMKFRQDFVTNSSSTSSQSQILCKRKIVQ